VHFVGLYYVNFNYSYGSNGCGNVRHSVVCSRLNKVGNVHEVSVRKPRNSLSELGRDCHILYLRNGWIGLTRVKTVSNGKVCISLVERVST
jgi:hypothetical protein